MKLKDELANVQAVFSENLDRIKEYAPQLKASDAIRYLKIGLPGTVSRHLSAWIPCVPGMINTDARIHILNLLDAPPSVTLE